MRTAHRYMYLPTHVHVYIQVALLTTATVGVAIGLSAPNGEQKTSQTGLAIYTPTQRNGNKPSHTTMHARH